MPGSKKPGRVLLMSFDQKSDDVIIRVKNLSKCYEIYDSPRDRLKQFLMPRLRNLLSKERKNYFREFWALKDVSFEVKRGEAIGIIGRNGSGKSTLLQMICGTLHPTSGTVQTNGRIAALLELGSGFNPEFTGRENVYMNASVLGLSTSEIDARFGDIVSFADIGDFIEQPVKTYSSGMMLRLAFAVIAHVDADILVIDEALAVGDAIFTQKCMGFIRRFQEKGSLIFVSHDAGSVQSLCQTGLWLKTGSVEQIGLAKKVAEAYLQFTLQAIYGDDARLISIESEAVINKADNTELLREIAGESPVDYVSLATVQDNIATAKGWKTGAAEIISVALVSVSDGLEHVLKGGELVRLTVRAKSIESLQNPIIGFLVRDKLGQDLFGENTLPFSRKFPVKVQQGMEFEGIFEFKLPLLPNGQYAVMTSLADGDLNDNRQHHWMHDTLILNVSSSNIRWGLVGIQFEDVKLQVLDAK